MANQVQPPQTINQAQAMLGQIGLSTLSPQVLKVISQCEGESFKRALAEVVNGTDDGSRRTYLSCVIAAVVPKTKDIIASLGFRVPHESTLIEVSKTEGPSFGRAIKTLAMDNINDPANAEAVAYLKRVLAHVCDPSNANERSEAPAPQSQDMQPERAAPSGFNGDTYQEPTQQRQQPNPRSNVREFQRPEPQYRQEGPGRASDGDEGDGGGRKYESCHIYGGKAALCFQLDTTRQGSKPTINIDAADAVGPRKYGWDRKVTFQLTVSELPLVLGVLYGYTHKIELNGHGANNEKSFSIENQGSKFFMKMGVRGAKEANDGRLFALPVLPKDTYLLMTMLMQQLQANSPNLDTAAIMTLVRRVCAMTDGQGHQSNLRAANG